MFKKLKRHAHRLKIETRAVYLAARHPGTSWPVKLLVAAIVAYALSPIDLIPDFVPVLGYLDDLILIPLGLALAIKLIPKPVMAECRERANASIHDAKFLRWAAGVAVVLVWVTCVTAGSLWTFGELLSK